MNTDLSIKSYTDLNELNKLKKAGREDAPRALEAVAEQFESLFLNMLLKNMRQANEGLTEGGLFDSNESKFYQEMLDQQLSVSLSSGKGIGLRDVLIRQLSPNAESDKQNIDGVAQSPKRQVEGVSGLDALLDQSAQLGLQASFKRDQQLRSGQGASVVDLPLMQKPFQSPEQFVQRLLPVAERVAIQAGVSPQVLVAQAALETGWGKHLPRHPDGSSSHNLFGIKADQRWDGERVTTTTLEYRDGLAQREKAAFRAYGSYEQSMQDYMTFIQSSPRYRDAMTQAHDPRAYIEQLQQAGYATDPEYSNKVLGILQGEVLQSAMNRS